MKKLVITLLFTVFSVSAYAKDTIGVYGGIGTGLTVGDIKTTIKEDGSSNLNLAESKNKINLFVGYNVLPYLAIEAEYSYGLNKNSNSVNYIANPDGTTDPDSRYDTESKFKDYAFFTNIVAKYPLLERHIPFIKLGVGYANYTRKDTDISISTVSWNYGEELKDYSNITSQGITYKIATGYEFAITKNHSLVAEYNYIITPKVNVKIASESFNGESSTFKVNNFAKIGYSMVNVAYKFTF